MNKLQQVYQVWKNKGPRIWWFQVQHEYRRKRGSFLSLFPTQVDTLKVIPLHQWQTETHSHFFIDGRERLGLGSELNDVLKQKAQRILNGETLFFSTEWKRVHDWHTHPVTGYKYDQFLHWTKVADLDSGAGDIKYVWERARFSFVYDIIRYDFHSGEDHAEWVFQQMESWIQENPLNLGPHYICSQEISLRVLNWMYALHFYKYSLSLTEARWELFLNAMYRQMEHVFSTLEFSRMAERNQRTLSQCLALYAFGLVFPFFKVSKKWKVLGKRWLEVEVAYQFYTDGTYIQHSVSDHRLAVQLLCWAIRLSQLNKQSLLKSTLDRAEKTFHFLRACQDLHTGHLSHYGSNDGTLYFPFTSCEDGDDRPLMNTLSWLVESKAAYETGLWSEEAAWLGFDIRRVHRTSFSENASNQSVTKVFRQGGIAVYNREQVLMTLSSNSIVQEPCCSNHLHFELWVQGQALLTALPYRAGKAPQTTEYNTVTINAQNHMLRHQEAWWYWVKQAEVGLKKHEKGGLFNAQVIAYHYQKRPVTLTRTVEFDEHEMTWLITDTCSSLNQGEVLQQTWHVPLNVQHKLTFSAYSSQETLQVNCKPEQDMETFIFQTTQKQIITKIKYLA